MWSAVCRGVGDMVGCVQEVRVGRNLVPLRVELLEVLDVRVLQEVGLNWSNVGLECGTLPVYDTGDRVVAVLQGGKAGSKLIHDAGVGGVGWGMI